MAHIDRPLLIHVAAAGEDRGRVVLAATSATPHPVAVAGAFAIARAFDAVVDCLLVECPDIVALTAHGFAREVSHSGRIAPLSRALLTDAVAHETDQARRVIAVASETAGVRVTTEVVRDTLGGALEKACAVHGPWNMVVLTEPLRADGGVLLNRLLAQISGATGVVAVGPEAAHTPSGDVIVVVEDVERLPQMIRVAERLAIDPAMQAGKIRLLLAPDTVDDRDALDGLVRLLLPDITGASRTVVEIVSDAVAFGTCEEVADALRRTGGRFVVARSGGLVVPTHGNVAALTSVLRCPLLLVR